MNQPFQMKINKDQLSKSLPPDQKNQFPVRAPNIKLKEDTSKTFLVKCISSTPLAFEMSKEELRINYLHSRSQGKIPDNRFNQQPIIPQQQQAPIGLPRMSPIPNLSQGPAPSQVVATGTNPFSKTTQPFQQQKQFNPLAPPTQQTNNMFTRQNNNIPFQNVNKNPFIPNNQFQNNQNQYQSRPHMFGATTAGQTGPGLVRQTSFGAVAQTQAPFSQPTPNPLAPNQPAQQQATGIFGQKPGSFPPGQTGVQTPGQLTQTPSFGNLGQPTQAQTSPSSQPPKPQGLFGAQTGNQPQSVFPTTLPQSTAPTQPQTQQQSLTSTLDANIKQLLQSKPNLWNILALDPDFKHGFNEHGRIYVKSVLQRIIDQNIISGEALNKIIIEIYKQMYGPDNFQKVLQNKKNQLKSFGQSKTNKTDIMSAKELHDNNVKSVFPEDINTLGDDFYRSFKRIPAKSRDSKILISRDDDDDKFKLQRKFIQVKRPQKTLEVKFKFIEIKKPTDTKKSQSTYTAESLQKIADNIYEIRKQQRKQIMPTEEDLPNVDGFSIVPSFDAIKTYTKHQLLSVPKVTISNEWGSVRFKAPISLLKKTLRDCIIINQKSVQIIDEEWKVRQAEITFKKFADFSVLQEEQQNELQEKITSWCEKQRFELIKVDRERGEVIIQI